MAPATTQATIRLTEPVIFLLGGQEHERARARRRRAARAAQTNPGSSPPGTRTTSPAPPPPPQQELTRGRPEIFVPPGPTRGGRSEDRGRSPAGRLQQASVGAEARDGSRSASRQREIVEGTTTGTGTAEEAAAADEPPPAMLRGLLTLTLAKPSRIRDISIKFRGLARTEWPEGIGPRRLDVMEENVLANESYNFFSASNLERRAASIGPGFQEDYSNDIDSRGRSASRRASSLAPFNRDTSIGRGYPTVNGSSRIDEEDGSPLSRIASETDLDAVNLEATLSSNVEATFSPPPVEPWEPSPAYELVSSLPSSPTASPMPSTIDLHPIAELAADASHPPLVPLGVWDLLPTAVQNQRRIDTSPNPSRTPPRSPRGPQPRDPSVPRRGTLLHDGTISPPDSPTLVLRRPSLLRGENSVTSTASESTLSPASSFIDTSEPTTSDAELGVPSSSRSSFERGRPRSRDPSQAPPTIGILPSAGSSSSSMARSGSTGTSAVSTSTLYGVGGSSSATSPPPSRPSLSGEGRQRSTSSSTAATLATTTNHSPVFRTTSRTSTSGAPVSRSARAVSTGKPSSRFSFAGLAGALRGKSSSRTRDAVRDEAASHHRSESPDTARGTSRGESRGRKTAMKALKNKLATSETAFDDDSDEELDDEKGRAKGWKEFRAGTYTYPISIPIAGSLPPSITAEFGNVTYSLKATIKRAGALTANLTATTDVVLVSCPGEDDTEESESIVVERFWETQMKYHIALSGKSFPIGAQIPISIRLNPMAKIKLYRVTAVLEQKTTYYAANRKLTRHEPLKKFPLLRIEHTDPKEALLPILSDDADAIRHHPLADWFINPTSSDDATPSCLDPIGPWHLDGAIQLPDCAARVTFSTIHDKANTNVSHVLKIMLRVERGDDDFLDSKGKRKLWDVIIETPIHILSCRCTQTLLPAYAASNALASLSSPTNASMTVSANFGDYDCGWNHTTNSATRPAASSTPRSASNGPPIATLAQNLQFARLLAGEESPAGEIPPSYQAVLAGAPSAGTLALAPGMERRNSSQSDTTTLGGRGSSLGARGTSAGGRGTSVNGRGSSVGGSRGRRLRSPSQESLDRGRSSSVHARGRTEVSV